MTSSGVRRVRAWAVVAAMCAVVGCGDDDAVGTDAGGTGDAATADAGMPDGGGDPALDGGQDDAGGGVEESRLRGLSAEAAAAICGAIARCCDAESQVRYFGALRENERLAELHDRMPPAATLDEASCTEVMTEVLEIQPFGDWVEAARAGRVEFVESELDACLEELGAAECGPEVTAALFDGECLGYGPPGGGQSQRRMFARTAGEGAPCQAISDGFGGGLYGSCDPDIAFCCYAREDGSCGLPTATVRSGTCRAVAALGAECSYGALPLQLCATGQFCDEAGRCAEENDTELEAGAECASAGFELLGVCTEGTYCDLLGTRVCAAQKANGESCAAPDECISGLCDAGTCAVDTTCSRSVRVGVSPESTTVAPGESATFAATVTGTTELGVTWNVEGTDCGSIESDGTYTAPAATFGRVCTVRATSVADPTRSATARALLEGVATLAGSGASGNANGMGTSAELTSPFGIAWHPAGFFLVTEGANRLRRVDLDGTVSSVTIEGAAISDPRAIVAAEDGTVYVAQGNHVVLSITGIAASAGGASGVAEILAGLAGTQGDADGTGNAARFRRPVGLAFDVEGSLLVAEATGSRIRRVQVTGPEVGTVTTVAGTGTTGFADGSVATATLYFPWGLAVGSDGIYLTGQDSCVRRIASGMVERVAGLCQNFSNTGNTDGPALDARFQSWPRAMTVEPSGALLVLDSGANLIRRLAADRSTISTVAGTRTASSGSYGGMDGPLLTATFALPSGIAQGPDGAYYVVDNGGHRVRRVVIAD